MYEGALVGVVVPAHNEEAHIVEVIDSVPDFVDRLYVIDDCSTDGTWAQITARADAGTVAVTGDPPVRRNWTDGGERLPPSREDHIGSDRTVVPVRHAENRGRGGAVKTGYNLALSEGIDVVAVMDGDGQMDPAILDRIVEPVVSGKADYAKGNRLVDADSIEQMSYWRLFGNALLTAMTKVASGYYGMRDPQNGYTAIDAETLTDISTESVYEGYGFLNDMLVRLGAHGKRVVDVHMRAIYDDEESGIQYRTFAPVLSWLLLKLFVWRLWVVYGFGDIDSTSLQAGDVLMTDRE
jgi:glycosyltransferase involved in cell wall biosynthesis